LVVVDQALLVAPVHVMVHVGPDPTVKVKAWLAGVPTPLLAPNVIG
jgi:hypothetical protein